jgi:hypothetical protein
MDDHWMRIIGNLADRVSGPMNFRFVLQPIMASIFAVIDGLHDAKAHKPPHLWAFCVHPAQRAEIIRDGWKSVGKVFVLALVLDVIYQISELHFLYPGEAIIVAFGLAIVPYVIVRGLVNRFASKQ